MEERILDYLKMKMPDQDIGAVTEFKRFHGGASRETYLVRYQDRGLGEASMKGVIVRKDPIGSLIETDRKVEFAAYQSFFGSDVPVPEPLFLEEDQQWLGSPFFVMEEIREGEAASPFQESPYKDIAEKIGSTFWSVLGKIGRTLPSDTVLATVSEVPQAEECWKKELSYWEGVIDEDELQPQPLVRAAIRYLKRNPPPPPQHVGVVHGDYRTGNFLYKDDGTITAILDWEMAHFGDPLEDLAWATNPLWAYGNPDLPAGMVSLEKSIALWEEASGVAVEQDAFEWWSIFSSVKGLGIWISSSKEYVDGMNKDPVLAVSGWYCTAAQNQVLLEQLKKAGVAS